MDIFDTNIWVFATARYTDSAVQLVREAKDGDRDVVLDPYIYNEVLNAFGGSEYEERADTLAQRFIEIVEQSETIQTPTQDAIERVYVEEMREDTRNQMLAETYDIQPKDAPIVSLAYEYKELDPTIFTSDEPFAEFTPAEHSLSWLSIEYVPVD